MPGMMESILNIGLNDVSLRGLIRATGNPRLAWDSYRRLVQSFAEVVHQCAPGPFDRIVRQRVETDHVRGPEELDTEAYRAITMEFVSLIHSLTGEGLPQDPWAQLRAAIAAVFRSWTTDKATEYRRINELEGLEGTAVTIQTMVFGNDGGTSGAGVGFTRNPASGRDELYLDFLFNAQGEDVVSGRRASMNSLELSQTLPEIYRGIEQLGRRLEEEFGDIQDFEFAIQEGKLHVLQTRSAQRTPWAALQVAVDQYRAGLIGEQTALNRLEGYDLGSLELTRFDLPSDVQPLATATVASIGVASGNVAFTSERAASMAETGRSVILVREETATADIAGIAAADGILTAAGFRTSHASVVARQMGKVCLVGCRELSIDKGGRQCRLGAHTLLEGDDLSLDGNSGDIYSGKLPIRHEKPLEALEQVRRWRELTLEETPAR
jgi:pyruvate,orthophosphate dikinase